MCHDFTQPCYSFVVTGHTHGFIMSCPVAFFAVKELKFLITNSMSVTSDYVYSTVHKCSVSVWIYIYIYIYIVNSISNSVFSNVVLSQSKKWVPTVYLCKCKHLCVYLKLDLCSPV